MIRTPKPQYWLDIESAPRNGELIRAYTPLMRHAGLETIIARWNSTEWVTVGNDGLANGTIVPTHWQELTIR